MYLKGKEKKWMIVVMCKETETIKKKNWYFKKMYYKIDNLILSVLNSM